jgi:hypothetical protein
LAQTDEHNDNTSVRRRQVVEEFAGNVLYFGFQLSDSNHDRTTRAMNSSLSSGVTEWCGGPPG